MSLKLCHHTLNITVCVHIPFLVSIAQISTAIKLILLAKLGFSFQLQLLLWSVTLLTKSANPVDVSDSALSDLNSVFGILINMDLRFELSDFVRLIKSDKEGKGQSGYVLIFNL